MIKKITTTKAPSALGPYSQAVLIDGFVFTAGQIYMTNNGTLLNGSIEEQTHQVMKNLQEILAAAGATFNDVVKSTIYLTDMKLYPQINAIYGEYFRDPYPARETVCVKELPMKAKIEISMIAIKTH